MDPKQFDQIKNTIQSKTSEILKETNSTKNTLAKRVHLVTNNLFNYLKSQLQKQEGISQAGLKRELTIKVEKLTPLTEHKELTAIVIQTILICFFSLLLKNPVLGSIGLGLLMSHYYREKLLGDKRQLMPYEFGALCMIGGIALKVIFSDFSIIICFLLGLILNSCYRLIDWGYRGQNK
ncbi:Hypothetical_protein [Hexamita inflata]|uniref:Hypothetical_protein n=1 Tax=Hexamita inflata TaxID=28002 RepID=A0AA86QHC8_9EUKA|nr:Hypothetical protein HINF_LOCUS45928 [Hexamita inflata]